MALTPYPVGLPTEAIMILIDKLRGSNVGNNDLLLASWNLVGYGLSQLSPKLAEEGLAFSKPVVEKFAAESDLSNEEAIAALESLLVKGDDKTVEGKLPWVKILSVAAKILLGILLI